MTMLTPLPSSPTVRLWRRVQYNGSNDDFALVRYNTDGSLDTTFDSDGKVTTAIGSGMTMLAPLPSSPTVRLWRRVQ